MSKQSVLLAKIQNPKDVRKLSLSELEQLSQELRDYIIATLSTTGGHLASNLGMIEATIAMHYVFDSPKDKFIFDVGHQVYAHKLLTGRFEKFKTLRQFKGISGFVNPSESEHDSFIAGHSSTSISLGVGMSIARDLKKDDNQIVVVIGDGGLTGGMALEALNHLGHIQKNILIILNDNEMSISNNLGGIHHYMKRLKETFFYKDLKDKINKIQNNLSNNDLDLNVLNLIKDVKDEASHRFETPGIVFEKLGINYYGPTDGHNIEAIISQLNKIKDIKAPKILHLITQKGKGFEPAEKDSIKYHGVSSSLMTNSNPVNTDKIEPLSIPKSPTYSDVFTQSLINIAKQDKLVMALTPATAEGSGLVKFGNIYPERFFDVAICEQHAVTCAAGMAKEGLKPVVSIYSTFLQRAIDQVIHDVAILNLDVLFCIDRAGIVEDGETHQGVFDISLLNPIPNLKILSPKDAIELKNMMYSVLCQGSNYGPVAIRYPRDKAYNYHKDLFDCPNEKIDYLKWENLNLNHNAKNVILANGSMVEQVENAFRINNDLNSYFRLVNARCIKPLDQNFLQKLVDSDKCETIITLEEGALNGGFGSSVLQWYHNYVNSNNLFNIKKKIINLGVDDAFIEHGSRSILLEKSGLSAQKLASKLLELSNNNLNVVKTASYVGVQ